MSNRALEEQISPEETRWVKDCIANKTLSHVVPLALGSVAAIKFASMKGYHLSLFAKAGVVFSSMVVGRLASIPSCIDAAEKQFPDGTLVAVRRGLKDPRTMIEAPGANEYQDQMPIMDYNSKMSQPSSQQPSQFSPSASPSSQQTYDDLRRRNRDQYTSRRTAPNAAPAPQDPAMYAPPQSPRPSETPYDPQYSQPISSSYTDPPSPYAESTHQSHAEDDIPSKVRRRKRVNVYGDEIED